MRAAIAQLSAPTHSNPADGIVLLGEPVYYRRFGFEPRAGLVYPGAPASHFLCLPFGSVVPQGVVQYHSAFDA